MYEVFLEHAAERDLKRLSAEDYRRILPHIKALRNDPCPTGCRKLSVQKAIGVSVLEITGSSMSLMTEQRPFASEGRHKLLDVTPPHPNFYPELRMRKMKKEGENK